MEYNIFCCCLPTVVKNSTLKGLKDRFGVAYFYQVLPKIKNPAIVVKQRPTKIHIRYFYGGHLNLVELIPTKKIDDDSFCSCESEWKSNRKTQSRISIWNTMDAS